MSILRVFTPLAMSIPQRAPVPGRRPVPPFPINIPDDNDQTPPRRDRDHIPGETPLPPRRPPRRGPGQLD